MLSSITPLGERSKGNRWWFTVAAHVVGSGLGGALTGLVLGALGWLTLGLTDVSLAVRGGIALVLAVVAVAFDAAGGRLRLPRIRRQVNEDWLTTYRGWVYGFGFGFQLGMGLVTIVTSAVIYLAFALAFLTASPWAGLLIGATFGLVRGATLVTGWRLTDFDRLQAYHRRLADWASAGRVAAIVGDGVALLAGVVVINSA